METGSGLTTVVRDQRRWSLTANDLKATIEQARWIILGLAVAGAILETVGAQIAGAKLATGDASIHLKNPDLAAVFGCLGAVALTIAAVVRQLEVGT
jgi:hypothetical protein